MSPPSPEPLIQIVGVWIGQVNGSVLFCTPDTFVPINHSLQRPEDWGKVWGGSPESSARREHI